MSKKTDKIEGTVSAWETGKLGRDENYVEVVELDQDMINAALNLKPISIRMNESAIKDLKMIAQFHGLGYQPLIRQILDRFIQAEKNNIAREVMLAELPEKEKKEFLKSENVPCPEYIENGIKVA